jgi:hypothetical protein
MFDFEDYYSANSSTNYSLADDQEVAFFVSPTGDNVSIESIAAVISSSGSTEDKHYRTLGKSPTGEKTTVWGWFSLTYTLNNYNIDSNNATILRICTAVEGMHASTNNNESHG